MKSFGNDRVDVCIVGSGAGGGPLAWVLARAGVNVLVLERGPWYTEKDFGGDEIAMCRRDFWHGTVESDPRIHAWKGQSPQKSVDSWIACCVGGGTVHMSGFAHRLHPEDFEMASRYGNVEGARLADWPIRYADLAPYYDQVEQVVGISGTAGGHPFEPPRSGPFPYPPLSVNPLAALVDSGARKLGLHAFDTPRLILSRPKGDRMACMHHPYCGSYGCEARAKGSTLHSVLAEAMTTDHCEVRANARVTELVTKDGRMQAVRYTDAAGATHEQSARVVVLSCSAIESARLLLLNGLANGSGLVGKNLMFSTLAKGWGRFDRQKLPTAMQPDDPNHFINRSVQDGYLLASRKGQYDKGGTLHFLLPHRNPIFAMERLSKRSTPQLWGQALLKQTRAYYNDVHEIEFEAFGEFLANDDTWVGLSTTVKDASGTPVAEVHLGVHPEDRANSGLLAQQGKALLDAAGADESAIETVGGITFVLQHGTCRMGVDAASSVLDPTCRTHEIDNLYVVDGSFMPTSGGVPTTWTIMANSFRVGALLAERFTKRELLP